MLCPCKLCRAASPSPGSDHGWGLAPALSPACAQFTELNRKEQLAKLAEARSEAKMPGKNKYKFTSAVNSQGFIEGKYVPLGEGEDVTASMDVISADTPELAAAMASAKKEFELPKP